MGENHDYLTETCAGINTTQWCKKEQCWTDIKTKLRTTINADLSKDLLPIGKTKPQGIESLNDPEKALIEDIKKVSSDVWFATATWGKETGNLKGFQCGISGTLGRYVGWSKEPSLKQAKQGLKILYIAYSKGLISEQLVEELLEKNHSFLDD